MLQGPGPAQHDLPATADDELEIELAGAAWSDLSAREHMLELIVLARAGAMPAPDAAVCRIVSVLLAELQARLVAYEAEAGDETEVEPE